MPGRLSGTRSCPLGYARNSNFARSGLQVVAGSGMSVETSRRCSSPSSPSSARCSRVRVQARQSSNLSRATAPRSNEEDADTIQDSASLSQRLSAALAQERPDFDKIEEMLARAVASKTSVDHILLQNGPAASCATALHKAAQAGSLLTTRAFLDAGGSVNTLNSMGRSPLHYACAGSHPDVVRELVLQRADVNQASLGGTTPLHVACQYGADECVAALLKQAQQFVMVDFEDDQRMVPARSAKTDFVKWLLQYYKEYPYGICRNKWRLNAIRKELTQRERAAFHERLGSLFSESECEWSSQDHCPICIEQFSSETPYETLACCHRVCCSCWKIWGGYFRYKSGENVKPFCPLCRKEDRLGD